MKEKSLTSAQVQVLILALLGVEPKITDVKPYDYEVSVKQISIESNKKDNMLGLEVNFSLSWFSEFAHHPIEEEYQLFIAYLETTQQTNPSFIKLIRIVGDEPGVIGFGNLVFVTDKLRELGIW